MVANHVLCQLSYTPSASLAAPPLAASLVGLGGFELPTSPLSGVRSNQLSYRPGGLSPQNLVAAKFRLQRATLCSLVFALAAPRLLPSLVKDLSPSSRPG